MIPLSPSVTPVLASVPEHRLDKIMRFYRTTPHPGVDLSPDAFVWRLGGIIYKEWCLQHGVRVGVTTPYHGHAFNNFINDEILWEYQRRERQGTLTPGNAGYKEVESAVLQATVNRGIDFVTKYPRWEDDPPQGVHMRTDLSKWMHPVKRTVALP